MEIFNAAEGGLENVSRSYKKFGLNIESNNDINFTEWCPGAMSISIFGDFNGWKRNEFVAKKNEFGCFCLIIKACDDGSPRIKHKQKYKIQI